MSTAEDRGRADGPAADGYPQFELDYLVDDREDPSEVTVFPASDEFDISTNWITMDASSVVPLDGIR